MEAEKQSKLVVVRSDPLLNYIALQEVFGDPVTGWAARHYLLADQWRPAHPRIVLSAGADRVRPSVCLYGAAHQGRKLRAERADAEYHHESDALRRWSGEQPPLLPPVKLISWEDPATRPGNDDTRNDKPSDDERDAAD